MMKHSLSLFALSTLALSGGVISNPQLVSKLSRATLDDAIDTGFSAMFSRFPGYSLAPNARDELVDILSSATQNRDAAAFRLPLLHVLPHPLTKTLDVVALPAFSSAVVNLGEPLQLQGRKEGESLQLFPSATYFPNQQPTERNFVNYDLPPLFSTLPGLRKKLGVPDDDEYLYQAKQVVRSIPYVEVMALEASPPIRESKVIKEQEPITRQSQQLLKAFQISPLTPETLQPLVFGMLNGINYGIDAVDAIEAPPPPPDIESFFPEVGLQAAGDSLEQIYSETYMGVLRALAPFVDSVPNGQFFDSVYTSVTDVIFVNIIDQLNEALLNSNAVKAVPDLPIINLPSFTLVPITEGAVTRIGIAEARYRNVFSSAIAGNPLGIYDPIINMNAQVLRGIVSVSATSANFGADTFTSTATTLQDLVQSWRDEGALPPLPTAPVAFADPIVEPRPTKTDSTTASALITAPNAANPPVPTETTDSLNVPDTLNVPDELPSEFAGAPDDTKPVGGIEERESSFLAPLLPSATTLPSATILPSLPKIGGRRGRDLEAIIIPQSVPGQLGPLPRPQEILAQFPSTSAADAARLTGVPLFEMYVNSPFGLKQDAIGDILGATEEMFTFALTPELIDTLEVEPLIGTIEQSLRASSPLFTLEPTDPLTLFTSNLTENIFAAIEVVDPPAIEVAARQRTRQQLSDTFLCAIIGNAASSACPLPIADRLNTIVETPALSATRATLNRRGVPQCLRVGGFARGCNTRTAAGAVVTGGCRVNGRAIRAQELDGKYKFLRVAADGYPVYYKEIPGTADTRRQGNRRYYISHESVSERPSIDGRGVKARGDLAVITTTDNPDDVADTESLFAYTKESECVDNLNFPACASGSWLMGRNVDDATTCNGERRFGICFFEAATVIMRGVPCNNDQ